jgi:hypothetical protein
VRPVRRLAMHRSKARLVVPRVVQMTWVAA